MRYQEVGNIPNAFLLVLSHKPGPSQKICKNAGFEHLRTVHCTNMMFTVPWPQLRSTRSRQLTTWLVEPINLPALKGAIGARFKKRQKRVSARVKPARIKSKVIAYAGQDPRLYAHANNCSTL
eukprot:1150252-Pelagomonas_calceolata.AAC.1